VQAATAAGPATGLAAGMVAATEMAAMTAAAQFIGSPCHVPAFSGWHCPSLPLPAHYFTAAAMCKAGLATLHFVGVAHTPTALAPL
jgi:hypothetical protein